MGKRGLCQLDHSELQLRYGPADPIFGGLQEVSEIPVLSLVLGSALRIPECLWTPRLSAVGMLEVGLQIQVSHGAALAAHSLLAQPCRCSCGLPRWWVLSALPHLMFRGWVLKVPAVPVL